MSKTIVDQPFGIKGIRVVEMAIGDNTVSALVTNFPKDDGTDFFVSNERAVTVKSSNQRNSKKSYVQWGRDNHLPQNIIGRANESPYVAPSLKHLIDSTFSAGIKTKYTYAVYRNGKIEEEEVDYKYAGQWIKGRIADLQGEMEGASGGNAFIETGNKGKPIDRSDEISQLKKDLTAWERTWEFLKRFKEECNMDLWLYEQASDATYFWNWFPTLELNVGEPGKPWEPMIRRISFLDTTCTRKGVMDSFGKVNYCVFSRSFADDRMAVNEENPDDYIKQTIIDALDPERAVARLRDKVKSQRNNEVRNRTLRYVIPMSIPTPGKFYYSFPSWWTIFKSRIFQYMLAMFCRRATMMENSTMFKYIIHIDEQYILYEQNRRNADTDDKREKVFNELMDEISDFIKNPKNNGKTLLTICKTIDGKKVKWVEIDTLDSPMKGSDVKEDIAEIANVMLFAMGIHPQTVGAIPGKDKMASGTEARELNTLQQLYLYGVKKLILYPLEVMKAFNGLDEHLKFDIPVHVLTTLDKNKQGVEEMKN